MLKGFLTLFVIVAVPAKDAFNFVLDLASYPLLVNKFVESLSHRA